MIDLSRLPAPLVIEPLDFETILATMKADLIALHPAAADVLGMESEPMTALLEAVAYRELLLRARINDAARACMLAYATGADLDQLAALLGVARNDGESDADLRARTQLAPESFSVAGPELAYVYHAKTASPDVADVSVDSPAPGVVRVTVLGPDGHAPQPLLDVVQAALSAEDVRPLCDAVQTESATVVDYRIEAGLVVAPGPDTSTVLDSCVAAAKRYAAQQFGLGRDISLSGVYEALHQPGVTRVDLTSPAADIAIDARQAPRCTGVVVSINGMGV